jgi:hypothetical protein
VPIDCIIVAASIYATFTLFEMGAVGVLVALIGANLFSRYRSRCLIRNILRLTYWYLPHELNSIDGIPGHLRKIRLGHDSAA